MSKGLETRAYTDNQQAFFFGQIKKMAAWATQTGKAFAFWREPKSDNIQAVADFSDKKDRLTDQVRNREKGFAISPFSQNSDGFFIKADLYLSQNGDGSHSEDLLDQIFEEHTKAPEEALHYHLSEGQETSTPTQESDYKKMVTDAVMAIESGKFEKVVPSKMKHETLPDNFDLFHTFLKACEKYPSAFVCVCSLPEVGTWFCATPEILVRQDEEGIFRTMALAGTQVADPEVPLAEIAWRQKEIEEQALVSRYIINCFKKIRLREFEEHGPKTVRAGGLTHLRTEFRVDTHAVGQPEVAHQMLELLHPTSAVCGMPKKPATEFIELHEKHDREFFSGYLGPSNISGVTAAYVNLRCMKVLADKAMLFAGAGVTQDSDPEKEWKETEAKCMTLLNTLR
ncbi:hypothetical protein FUAX_27930 [Fulvitalea axinellae]|uniref:Chorismate-utilising enzyme C-terminal domain-containing protein n=1 Tax=Fulvitalea axinellae TaxID=1182444 RepID=A0AAU9DBA0_9BACT|nr:hypothetical protein FUAX_27930 [Fulvitalea axinellae]